jgi:hypothetical protein
MNALVLLLTLTTSMIVLRSGDRIAVEGSVTETAGVVTFRSGGLLYSLPAEEVERIEQAAPAPAVLSRDGKAELRAAELRVSEAERKRLIAELEKNHSGQPSAPLPPVVVVTPAAGELKEDEAWWRSQARAREENLRRAQEELLLMETRASELRDQIHSFLSLGYKARQFTYQTTQLARTEEQIPYARLEVTRAERAWQQFREDARRAGILPGWLR